MKKLYFIAFFTLLAVHNITSQTTVSYPQRASNYTKFENGGFLQDNSTDEVVLWANQGNKEVVGWRNFTETGLPGGTPSTMAVGDSFTISLYCSRAYGQIGISLLSNPLTGSWLNRFDNYAVQLNLDGEGSGSWKNWEIVGSGITNTGITGDIASSEYILEFTLTSTTEMKVIITKNTIPTTFNITLNNTNDITGYSIYLADDWNGNGNDHPGSYWKPTTEYTYATTLPVEEFIKNSISLNLIDNRIQIEGLEYNQKFKLAVYDINGRLIKKMNEKSKLNLNELSPAFYILKLKTENNSIVSKKVIKR